MANARWLTILLPVVGLVQGCGRNSTVQAIPTMPPSRAELLAELDPRLRSQRAVPDDENAWVLWQEVGRESLPKMAIRDRVRALHAKDKLTPADHEEIVKLGKLAEPMAKAIARGLTMRYCQAPFVAGVEVKFPELAGWKDATLIMMLGMRSDADQGRDAAAFERLELVLQFCKKLREGKPTLIPYLVDIGIEMSCMKLVHRMLIRGSLNSSAGKIAALITRTAGDLSGYQDSVGSEIAQPTIGILMGIDETETNESLKSSSLPLGAESMLPGLKVGDLAKILGRHERPYDIRQTARDLNAAVRPLMAQDPAVYHPIEGDLAPWDRWLASWPKALVDDSGQAATEAEIDRARAALADEVNPFGRMIIGQLLLAIPQFVNAEYSRRTHREATRFLSQWIADGRGAFPESFDPFSGKPFRIDPARRIYWSVGLNGVDDQGTGMPGGADREQPDIVFRLP